MEDNNKDITPESSVSSNQTVQNSPQIPPVNLKIYKTFTIISSLLLLLFLGLIGLVVNQNQQLKKQIEDYNQSITPTPLPEIELPITSAVDITDSWKTYTSAEYGFSFKYPQEYFIKDGHYGDGKINPDSIRIKENSNPEGLLIEVSLFKDFNGALPTETSNLSFYEFATDRVLTRFAADGPRTSTYSDKVVEEKKYTNENGISGYVLYINVVTKISGENPSETNSTKGPIYVLDLSQQTDARGIIFSFRDNFQELHTSIDEQNLEKMISTFKF